MDKPWMDLLDEGKNLVLEFEEWINTPSVRGLLKFCVNNPDGSPDAVYGWTFQAGEDEPYAYCLPALFPWASLSVDEDFYRDKEQLWPEAGEVLAPIRPWTVEAGEIARFRLKLSLNEMGRSFLEMERFLRCEELSRPSLQGKMNEAYENGVKYRLHKKR